MARRNIELKARCADLGAAEAAALRWGAAGAGVIIQTDTYFNVPKGRLKLREIQGGDGELIWYQRENRAQIRGSDYVVTPVPDPSTAREALGEALSIRGVVRKHRHLHLWRNVRIHLDKMEGLGTFVEFEAVLAVGDEEERSVEDVRELARQMGITPEDWVAESYSDLAEI